MKQCKNCKAHLSIDPKITKCPRCQSDLRHWVDRHPFLTGLFIFLAIVFFITRISGDKKKITISTTPVKQEKTEVTVTPVSKELAGLSDYSLAVILINKTATESITTRSKQLERYQNWTKSDYALFYEIGTYVEKAYDALTGLTPPKILDSVHQKLVKGLGLWKQSISVADKGVYNKNGKLLSEAADLMNEGTKWIEEANKELKEITEEMKKSTKK